MLLAEGDLSVHGIWPLLVAPSLLLLLQIQGLNQKPLVLEERVFTEFIGLLVDQVPSSCFWLGRFLGDGLWFMPVLCRSP